jgi:hypothetical protein
MGPATSGAPQQKANFFLGLSLITRPIDNCHGPKSLTAYGPPQYTSSETLSVAGFSICN